MCLMQKKIKDKLEITITIADYTVINNIILKLSSVYAEVVGLVGRGIPGSPCIDLSE